MTSPIMRDAMRRAGEKVEETVALSHGESCPHCGQTYACGTAADGDKKAMKVVQAAGGVLRRKEVIPNSKGGKDAGGPENTVYFHVEVDSPADAAKKATSAANSAFKDNVAPFSRNSRRKAMSMYMNDAGGPNTYYLFLYKTGDYSA